MTETVAPVAKPVPRPRPRKTEIVSASALAQHLDCSRTYIGKLEAEGVIQHQGGGFPLDLSRVAYLRYLRRERRQSPRSEADAEQHLGEMHARMLGVVRIGLAGFQIALVSGQRAIHGDRCVMGAAVLATGQLLRGVLRLIERQHISLGRPGCSSCPVRSGATCSVQIAARPRLQQTPGLPAPSDLRGQTKQTSGKHVARTRLHILSSSSAKADDPVFQRRQ